MNKKSNFVRGGLLAVASILLASVIASAVGFIKTQSVQAAGVTAVASEYGVEFTDKSNLKPSDISLKWINARTIELTFTHKPAVKLLAVADNDSDNDYNSTNDQRNADDSADYTIQGWQSGCNATIKFGKSMDKIIDKVNVDIDFSASPASDCVDGNELSDVPVADPTMSIAYFRWVDSGKIESAGEDFPGTFLQVSPTADSEVFIQDGKGPGCTDRVIVSADKKTLKYYNVGKENTKQYDGKPDATAKLPGDCKYSTQRNNDDEDQGASGLPINNVDLYITDVTANSGLASGTGTSSSPSGSGSASETPSCELSGSPISWIVCPIITLGLKVTSSIFSNLIEPYLRDTGITTDPNSSFYKAWANFRTIGNILLLFGLLFLVFGQAIGGGLVDAYTAKKLLPRVVIAAIAINLSIYLVAIANDIILVVGNGVGTLITAPFQEEGIGKLRFSGGLSSVLGFGALGFLLYKGLGVKESAGTFFKNNGVFSKSTANAAGTEIMGLVITVVIPVFLITLAVVGTIIIRNGIVMLTAIVAPVAIALMVIPGAEKYFKKWRELFFSSLIVYPIIIVFFAIGNVMSSVILSNNEGSTFGNIIAIVALFAPMVMIPFAFKFAGGAIAAAYGAAQNYGNKAKAGIYGNEKDPNSWRNRTLAKRNEGRLDRREAGYANSMEREKTAGGFRRGLGRVTRKSLGYNIDAERSAQNAATDKELSDQIATGNDAEIRGLTVNKRWAIQKGVKGVDWREETDGSRSFRTAGGAWVSEAEADAGRARWGHSFSAKQKALSYEMGKAATQEEQDRIVSRFSEIATADGGWGLTSRQAGGLWIGAAYANQNSNLEFKHMKWDGKESRLKLDGRALMTEIDEKRGSFQMAQQNADTWTAMRETVVEAQEVITTGRMRDGSAATTQQVEASLDIMRRARRVAASNEVRNMAARIPDGDDAGAPTGGGSGAPGRVQEEITAFLDRVKDLDDIAFRNENSTFNPAITPQIQDMADPAKYMENRPGDTVVRDVVQNVRDPATGRVSQVVLPNQVVQRPPNAQFRSERPIEPSATDPATNAPYTNRTTGEPENRPTYRGDGPDLKPPTPAV